MNVSSTIVIRSGLSEQEKIPIALGIYRSFTEKIEDEQGQAIMMFTYYSFEDLPSDEIGFYLALKYQGYINLGVEGSDTSEAWDWLSRTCGFNSNRSVAIEDSIDQYKYLGGSENIDMAYANLIAKSLNPLNRNFLDLSQNPSKCSN